MRQLTFKGFLRQYVIALSEQHSSAIYPLVQETISNNLRLKEPLFLYALAYNHVGTLLDASKNTPLYESYFQISERFTYEQILDVFSAQIELLPEDYQKIWRSYQSVVGIHERDIRVKDLLREKIIIMKSDKVVSTYRICKDLDLNVSNINSWLKNGTASKVSLDTARKVWNYMRTR